MANNEHLRKLREGVEAWNWWRKGNPGIRPDLSGTEFSLENLSGVNLDGADLIRTSLSRATLSKATFRNAKLNRADLLNARLVDANCFGANLSNANLSGADLTGANLGHAELFGANLTGAILTNTDFSQAKVGVTIFANIDLRQARNLGTLRHREPSTVGVDTLYQSCGEIPDEFLTGCALPILPEEFISYVRRVGYQWNYYSCFISYSSRDRAFVTRLYNDLQVAGVTCWYAPKNLKTGDRIRDEIDSAIQGYDKLLLVISRNSVESQWVETEVERAIDREHTENREVLFPVMCAFR